MKTLLVDNYDSYTYNLFQLIAEVNGVEPVVLQNDSPEWDDLDVAAFDNTVISPGPGRPQSWRDLGRSRRLLARADLPLLGVCLGHQAIAYEAGAQVTNAPRPRHGYLTTVRHDGHELFAGLPREFTAVRYHSLCVTEPLPPTLIVTARAEDGVVMGLRHRDRPQWGVQFHPESIATEHGARVVANFAHLTRSFRRCRPVISRSTSAARPKLAPPVANRSAPTLRLHLRTIGRAVDTERAFATLYRDSDTAFWLDGGPAGTGWSGFSFLGDASGPLGEVLTYRVADGAVTAQASDGTLTREAGTIFDVLDRRLRSLPAHPFDLPADLPFDLVGGYVGYFGYELKTDCGSKNRHRAPTPDAVWVLADRMIAVDHADGRTYVFALSRDDTTAAAATTWIDRVTGDLESQLHGRPTGEPADVDDIDGPTSGVPPRDIERALVRDRARYLADIAECRRYLFAGETYEICLTNTARLPAPEGLALYRRLRRANPAPYSALLRFGDLTVASSSPERFLRVDRDGAAESRPIKGTAPRAADLRLDETLRHRLVTDPKTRAENLMIVDLLRNDLGRVCEVGSVEVPEFMVTESYATVHQLVSTIRGRLRPGVGPVNCARAAFPCGSMTGAPKLRTLEIIDGLETEARGVYSGALGYFGPGGTADLSVVIRTAVLWRGEMAVGAGGAIVVDSDPVAEFEEMLLKAAAPLRAAAPLTPEAQPHRAGRSWP